MNYASKWEQVRIYFGKCRRGYMNEAGWKSLIGAVLIPLLIVYVTDDAVFKNAAETKRWAFTIICACLWLGLFNSITSICKERDIIKHEYRSGMFLSSYIAGHMLFEMIICAIETVCVVGVTMLRYWSNFQSLSGSPVTNLLAVAVTFFLTILAADALAILISSIVKTPVRAMYIMPFALIFQLVFAGLIFPLEGMSKEIARLTLSKWGYEAVLDITGAEKVHGWFEGLFTSGTTSGVSAYWTCWFWLIVFILVYAYLACRLLKLVEKDGR